MHALQSFDFPVYAGALLVCDKDVQKPFGEMADSARGLHVHLAEVGGHCESVKQREWPLVVFEEDFFPHDEHIAECCGAAVEYGIGIRLVIGMPLAQNVVHMA